jgi:hypothetical protein
VISLTLSDGSIRNVIEGTVTLPRSGIWLSDLFVIGANAIEGKVVLNLGNVAMPAIVSRSPVIDGTVHVRILGGTGNLSAEASVKHYSRPLASDIVRDLLRDAGQSLSATADTDTLSSALGAWTTLAAPTGTMLSALCSALCDGAGWRILFDGTLWIGKEKWPTSPLDFRSLVEDGANAAEVIGSSLPALWPGTVLNGRKVDTVIHSFTLDEEEIRTTVLYVRSSDDGLSDRAKRSWQSMRDVQDPLWRYAPLYHAKLVAQSGDADVVDVRPDDSTLPDMAGVPLRHGLPGLRVQVALGSYLRVGWDDGRPDKPFAALWDTSSVLKASIVADDLRLGGRDAAEALILGNTAVEAMTTKFTAMAGTFTTIAEALTSLGQIGQAATCTTEAAACARFAGQLGQWLSQVVRTK